MNKEKINITLEIESHNLQSFEYWLKDQVKVLEFKIIPDTSELYKNDDTFKKLCKLVKESQLERDRYYNKKRIFTKQ